MKVKCSCKHEQQDALHGQQMRVANLTTKDQARCTVCKTLHNLPNKKAK